MTGSPVAQKHTYHDGTLRDNTTALHSHVFRSDWGVIPNFKQNIF
jgi:hypothetical protein